MLVMSFSFAAEGTRGECIQQLDAINSHGHSADGQFARGLVLAFLADAPTSEVRYKISAYGHRDPGGDSIPSLQISLALADTPPPEPASDAGAHKAEIF